MSSERLLRINNSRVRTPTQRTAAHEGGDGEEEERGVCVAVRKVARQGAPLGGVGGGSEGSGSETKGPVGASERGRERERERESVQRPPLVGSSF
jgi:hypothetical protein